MFRGCEDKPACDFGSFPPFCELFLDAIQGDSGPDFAKVFVGKLSTI